MDKLRLKVITNEGIIIDEDVLKVSIVSLNGKITILKNHSPLVGGIRNDVVEIFGLDQKTRTYVAGSGLFQVENNTLKIVPLYFVLKNDEVLDMVINRVSSSRLDKIIAENHSLETDRIKIYLIDKLKGLKNSK